MTLLMRRWVKSVICAASSNRLSVKHFLGKEEHQVPLKRDSSRLWPAGADGATLSVFVLWQRPEYLGNTKRLLLLYCLTWRGLGS